MIKRDFLKYIYISVCLLCILSCARMGQPDGGWYDETPPRVVGSSPADKATNVKSKKIYIYFNEFIQLDNPTEKVVVSPPQLEAPDIKGEGKRIVVELKDSLKSNTTYTIDFSDAISDNNESNPLGNYTYTFSTGDRIDTLETSGYVLNAQNLEPIKGILVGLYNNLSDTVFSKSPLLRVSHTDSRGHFVIRGIAPGSYRMYALQDADGNYMFNQKSEMIAFNHDIINPYSKPDVRPDTLWKDSLHIDSIRQVPYTHFFPDNVVLRAFTETLTDRYLLKTDRTEPNRFTLFFSYGHEKLPVIHGLNFNEKDAFIIEPTAKNDTITYWLRDTALCNQDTLRMQLQYMASDSTGTLYDKTDTMEILAKEPYAKRMKKLAKATEEWQKKQEKAKKHDEPYDTVMKPEALKPEYGHVGEIDPDQNITVKLPTPLARLDTAGIHLYSKHDTLWYKVPFRFEAVASQPRTYEITGEWKPGVEYSLEVDSAVFRDIYGKVSDPMKQGLKVRTLDSYGSIFVSIQGTQGNNVIVQLLNKSDGVVKEVKAKGGQADFYYIKPEKYYLRAFEDDNGNGIWDTGLYKADKQAEKVYYDPRIIECKAKWDISESWNVNATDAAKQKPSEITKQKPDQQKKQKNRNAERAKSLGLIYVPNSVK